MELKRYNLHKWPYKWPFWSILICIQKCFFTLFCKQDLGSPRGPVATGSCLALGHCFWKRGRFCARPQGWIVWVFAVLNHVQHCQRFWKLMNFTELASAVDAFNLEEGQEALRRNDHPNSYKFKVFKTSSQTRHLCQKSRSWSAAFGGRACHLG